MTNKRDNGGFKADPVTISASDFIIRTYDATLHKQQIFIEEGSLWVYEDDKVIEKIPRYKAYKVKIGVPNKLGGGPEGVSFIETYRQ